MKDIRKKILQVVFILLGVMMLSPIKTQAASKKENGWVTESGKKYYYKSGNKTLGLQKIGKYKYYFDLKTGVMVKNKWKRLNNKHYYFLSNGRMATSRWISNKYYVNKKGVRVSNKWVGKRFVGENGKWIKKFKGGWYKISGNWYFYTKKGVKKTGWITYKGKKYYLNENGVRVAKRQTINSKTYQFSAKGALKTSGWIKSGKWYYHANKNGVLNVKDRMNAKTRSAATIIEYKSSTLQIRLEKRRQYNTNYWTAHVKTKNAKQLVHTLSYGTYGGTLQRTSSAVDANNAILGINGSAFNGYGVPSPLGMCITNGKIYGNYATSYTVMCIMKDGSLKTAPQGLYGKALLNMGVRDTLNFGPVLLNNGREVPLDAQGDPRNFASLRYQDPRTAIGMVRPGEYVLIAADGRRSSTAGLTASQMIQIFRSYGCSYAYNLDGGGSTTIAYKGYVLNSPSDGSERPCGDFLLFKN